MPSSQHQGMAPRRILAIAVVLAAVVMVLAWSPVRRHYHAAHLLAGLARPAASATGVPSQAPALEETELQVPREGRSIRARIYRIAGGARRPGVVVAHGVHYQGIDERRLVPFARALAREGLVVLTPELRELADYRISEESERDIHQAALYLSSRGDLVDSPRVGILGFSFAGGLSLVAAAEPDLASHLAWVMSIGGHHDLARVLRFFADDEIPSPRGVVKLQAHEYGLVVLAYGNVDAFVPPEDQEAARDTLRAWLREDRPLAQKQAARCGTEPCRHLFELVREGRTKELGPRIRELIAAHQDELARLSPRGRLSGIPVPIYLLHGATDSVIPPTESEWAAAELGDRPHVLLISPLIQHVEVDRPAGWRDKLALVHFLASIM